MQFFLVKVERIWKLGIDDGGDDLRLADSGDTIPLCRINEFHFCGPLSADNLIAAVAMADYCHSGQPFAALPQKVPGEARVQAGFWNGLGTGVRQIEQSGVQWQLRKPDKDASKVDARRVTA